MNQKKDVIHRFRKLFDLSAQPISSTPIVEIAGNRRLLIENHKGVVEYEMERIVVLSKSGRIIISGSSLEIQQMSQHQLVIIGHIGTVSIEGGGDE